MSRQSVLPKQGLLIDGATICKSGHMTSHSDDARTSRYAMSRVQRRLKRTLDFTIGSIGVALFSPILMLAAIAIRVSSPGPIMFNSIRVGLNGRLFRMYKFRTMVTNAEELLPGLQSENRGGKYLIRIPDDPRITKVGRFLRRTSLDELPQLVNVVKGDMSLVGPRPQYPTEVAEYSPEQRRRLAMPPGMTGLWQVSARGSADFNEWVRIDVAYIDKWSVLVDLVILVRTLAAVFRGPR